MRTIDFTRIDNDTNGNPRYVCHYSDLLTKEENDSLPLTVSPIYKVNDNLAARYQLALKKARKIGGRKYNTKKFSGGIVFQSYNIQATEKDINQLINNK